MDWQAEEREKQKFWKKIGECQGYIETPCPNCGRIRVEHWSCGKDICEKCHWCIQDKGYFMDEHFDL